MNSNGIIIVLLTILVMVGIYLAIGKKDSSQAPATVIKEVTREVPAAQPANDGDSVELKLNRKIKL
jgi:hypothetical protein